MQTELINYKISTLINKNVEGITAQVRNPIYISEETPPIYRVMKKIETFKEKGKMWVQLHWYGENGDNCTFTGCTLDSDTCTIQITADEFSKLNKQS